MDIRMLHRDATVLSAIDLSKPLTIKEAYQLVLYQSPDTIEEYRLVAPLTSVDVASIRQSAVGEQVIVTHQHSSNPYVLKVHVRPRCNDSDEWLN